MDDDFYRFNPTGKMYRFSLNLWMQKETSILSCTSAGSILLAGIFLRQRKLELQRAFTDDYVLRVYLYQDSGTIDGNTYDLRVVTVMVIFTSPTTPIAPRALLALARIRIRLVLGCDWRFNTSVGDALDLTAMFDSTEGDIDMVLFDASGTEVADTSGVTGTEQIMYTTTSSGAHVLRVFLYRDAGTAPGIDYELTIAP